jgi:hypothetical protein
MAVLTLTVGAINRELGDEPDETSRLRKLKEWVDRLHEALQTVASDIGAHAFSISVGFPANVGVSLEWKIG